MNLVTRALLAGALLLGLGGGCSRTDTPEQRVRALIAQAEDAAERKEIRTLRGYVSERYRDEAGRDRRAVEGILRLYLLRNERLHLLTRIERVTVMPPDRAEAVVYVAMAARPIANAAELAGFRADLYRFEVEFSQEDGEWRVERAAWRPAEPADFIYSK